MHKPATYLILFIRQRCQVPFPHQHAFQELQVLPLPRSIEGNERRQRRDGYSGQCVRSAPVARVLPDHESQVFGRYQIMPTLEAFLKGGLQKLEWQMYTKKNSNPHENASKTPSLSLDSSLTTGRVLGTGGSPCSWPAASRSLGGPLQHPGRFPHRRTPRTGPARTGVTPLPASGLCFVPSTSAGLTSSSRR